MLVTNQAKRNPANTNQKLYWSDQYCGFPVQVTHGSLVEQYLEALVSTAGRAQSEFSRVCAVRFDLRFSQRFDLPDIAAVNEPVRKFMSSLQDKLDWKYQKTREQKGRANVHGLRYIWARETGAVSDKPHYHIILLLNGSAYRSIGDYSNPEAPGLYNLISEAWAGAIGLDHDLAHGLVSVPSNGSWMLHRGDLQCLGGFIHAASYLCKAETKQFGSGVHGFGYSRH